MVKRECIGGLCDRGLERQRNEDAIALASGDENGGPWAVLVVCDGVSSSTNADVASRVASQAALDALVRYATSAEPPMLATDAAMAAALQAAHLAICCTPLARATPTPSGTTIVAALVSGGRLTLGWVGDSRAYWVSSGRGELLSRDHSWVNEVVLRGEMTEAEAMGAPLAHALTRCLGPLDRGPVELLALEPDVRVLDLLGPGHVILCTDGLWNYFPDAVQIAEMVRAAGPGATPGEIARCLVDRALASGGGDNVSVAVYEQT